MAKGWHEQIETNFGLAKSQRHGYCLFLKRWPNPSLFLFISVLFKHHFIQKWDSNSNFRSIRRVRRPLDHRQDGLFLFQLLGTTMLRIRSVERNGEFKSFFVPSSCRYVATCIRPPT